MAGATAIAAVVLMWALRALGPRSAGFAFAVAGSVVALGIARSVNTLPLLVRFSGAERERWREATSAATGTPNQKRWPDTASAGASSPRENMRVWAIPMGLKT